MDDLEKVKDLIMKYELYKSLYDYRRNAINEKVNFIYESIPVRGGESCKFDYYSLAGTIERINKEASYKNGYIINKMNEMISKGELTKEEFDMLQLSFNDYMFKYGTEFLA
jgi:hypothetical protein